VQLLFDKIAPFSWEKEAQKWPPDPQPGHTGHTSKYSLVLKDPHGNDKFPALLDSGAEAGIISDELK